MKWFLEKWKYSLERENKAKSAGLTDTGSDAGVVVVLLKMEDGHAWWKCCGGR